MRGEGCARTDRCGCALRVSGLACRYAAAEVFAEASFSLDQGSISFLVGPNGAGKSTTMNILTGYLSASEGVCKIDGIDILENPLAAKKKLGYLPEQPPLYLDRTPWE